MTINELLAIAGLTANDEIPIWDAEATGEPTKKITAQNLAAAVVALANLVTGVKGNAESNYRQGNVNLTPANIGAVIDISTGPTWTEWENPLPYDVGDANIDHIKSNFRAIFDTMKLYPDKICMGVWVRSGRVIFWGYAYAGGEWGDLFYKAIGNAPVFYHGKLDSNGITVLSVTETVSGYPLPVTIGGTGATTKIGACTNIGAVNCEIDGSKTFISGSINDAPLGMAAYAGDNSNVTQKPYSQWFTVFTFNPGSSYWQQVALPWFNNNSIAFRIKDNAIWGSWRYIATQTTEPTA